jgi:hypothetical protein
MNQLLKDILTCKDGESFDALKVVGVLGVLVFICLSIAAVALKTTFDHQGYGIGLGSTLGALGFGLNQKKTTEPGGMG